MEFAARIKTLTLGEVAKVEELSGANIDELDSAPKGKMFAALAYVFARRARPEFNWDDALNLTMDQAYAELGIAAEVEQVGPTSAQ